MSPADMKTALFRVDGMEIWHAMAGLVEKGRVVAR